MAQVVPLRGVKKDVGQLSHLALNQGRELCRETQREFSVSTRDL